MRVIAGSARSLKLKTVEGVSTRPTTDRIKETLFNMLNPYVYGANFLDLFAGSGGIGIEALSRGSRSCVFVDNNSKCTRCINDNLKFTKFDNKSEVINSDVIGALRRIESSDRIFDIIFMDPPYDKGIEEVVIKELEYKSFINDDTIIIVEASLNTDFEYLNNSKIFEIFKIKEYKTNKHVFIRRKEI